MCLGPFPPCCDTPELRPTPPHPSRTPYSQLPAVTVCPISVGDVSTNFKIEIRQWVSICVLVGGGADGGGRSGFYSKMDRQGWGAGSVSKKPLLQALGPDSNLQNRTQVKQNQKACAHKHACTHASTHARTLTHRECSSL